MSEDKNLEILLEKIRSLRKELIESLDKAKDFKDVQSAHQIIWANVNAITFHHEKLFLIKQKQNQAIANVQNQIENNLKTCLNLADKKLEKIKP